MVAAILSACSAGSLRPCAAEDRAAPFPPEQIEFFEKQVRPIFAENCHKCHGAQQQKGGLRLDSRAAILKGGDTGPAAVPGQPDESEFLLAVSYDPTGYQMPPDGKLPDETIAVLRKWVEMGAPWPDDSASAAAAGLEFDLAARARHWSFQPLSDVTPPPTQRTGWARTPVDRFVLAKLEAAGLAPATEADRPTWFRRAWFDTVGLPPPPDEVEAFVHDDSPAAYERATERLLSSPHFGERWGRHWLDLVRYAESRGHEFDYNVPNAWQYRDYVLRALNDDVPYDQFVAEHVAGDLLVSQWSRVEGRGSAPGSPQLSTLNSRLSCRLHPLTGANESILATGFWFLGEWVHSPVDIRHEEAERFENMIDVYAKTFLALTVACARCHDHKFDPVTQKDFYALQGYLQSSSYRQAPFETLEHNRRVARELQALNDRAKPVLLKTVAKLVEPGVRGLDKYLLASRAALRAGLHSDGRAESGGGEPGLRRQLVSLAREYAVDAQRLARWLEYLQSAEGQSLDLLQPWGRVAGAGGVVDALTARGADEPAARDRSQAAEWLARARTIVNYADGRQDEFLPDGVVFGVCAVSPGDLRLGDDERQPIARIAGLAAAERDPVWDALQIAPGTQHDPGGIETWHRGGRTLRTPSFDIDGGRVFCLINGGCNTYAAVDSHIVINGPLHGGLVKQHPAADGWRWIEHDVSRYQGHRAHLEFVARGEEPLAVALVVQAATAPPSPTVGASAVAPVVPLGRVGDATEDAAAAHDRREFETALALMHGDAVHLRVPPSQYAALIDWIVRRPELLIDDVEALRRKLAEAARPFLAQRRRLIESIRTVSAAAPCMLDGSGEDEYVFIRGNWKKPGDIVPRRFLEVFAGGEGRVESGESRVESSATDSAPSEDASPITSLSALHSPLSTRPGSGRFELALQMIDPAQTPILPRVIVNRIWQHYFGRGLVPTPDDFGHMGQPPSHPELLDWLAGELVRSGWSLKHVHRLILGSATYGMASGGQGGGSRGEGQGSSARPAAGPPRRDSSPLTLDSSTLDPQNILLHQMPLKRLEGEIIRDAILALSGRLDDRLYGSSVPVHLTPFMEGRGRPAESGPIDGDGRRSLYLAVRRNFPEPFFQAFDFPNPHATIGRRSISNVPAQALALMNNPFVVEQARAWAERVRRETAGATAEERIAVLYAQAFSRPPTGEELASGRDFLLMQADEYDTGIDDPRVWADYCHVLLNVKEFVFVR